MKRLAKASCPRNIAAIAETNSANKSVWQLQEVSKDVAIDGLVKEIDFCIQQLKIANG